MEDTPKYGKPPIDEVVGRHTEAMFKQMDKEIMSFQTPEEFTNKAELQKALYGNNFSRITKDSRLRRFIRFFFPRVKSKASMELIESTDIVKLTPPNPRPKSDSRHGNPPPPPPKRTVKESLKPESN